MEIEINGEIYESVPQPERKIIGKSSKLMMLASMFAITNPLSPRPTISKHLPVSDIIKEFELIQLKQSKLSRSERDRVVTAFNKQYRKVNN